MSQFYKNQFKVHEKGGGFMALYTISDLHLPLGVDKPMDIFGKSWEGYVQKLQTNWQQVIRPDDVVVLPGDFSWAMYIDDAKKDFEFLKSLNGTKILLKGNHDYWWETMSKMKRFTKENAFSDVLFLQNNSYEYKNISICGTRGWNLPISPHLGEDDKKIYKREAERLKLSLESAKKENEKIVFIHFPPISKDCTENEFTRLFENFGVKKCIYGHLHAKSSQNALTGEISGVEYLLVSCDYLQFTPVKLSD